MKKRVLIGICTALFLLTVTTALVGGDEIEKLSGQKFKGKIIQETEYAVKLEISMGGTKIVMGFKKKDIHAITDSKGRRVINEKSGTAPVRRPAVRTKPKTKPKEVKTAPQKDNFDWPIWRGPDRDGISKETGFKTDLEGNPNILWKKELGGGYSCISVANGKAYTMGNAGGQDTVFCFDAETGKEIWTKSYACGTGGYPGPRATPSVDGKTVYTLSREGHLNAYNAENGSSVWSKNIAREVGAQRLKWAFSGSPVIHGNLLLLNITSGGIALNKKTGSVEWKTSGLGGYASPVPVTIGGKEAVLNFGGKALTAVDLKTGRKMWSFTWITSHDVNAADPIMHNNQVFISSNYGKGCALLNVTATGATPVYTENKSMKNHMATCVLYEDHLYGFSDSSVTCIEWKTGSSKWSNRGYGKGTLMLADGILILLSERGELGFAKADPSSFQEISKTSILPGKTCWTVPTLSNGRIYARNHKGSMVCVDVKK